MYGNPHITQLVCSCYEVLCQLHSIRRSLPRSALTTLVTSFIISKIDYCNVALAGLPQYERDRVQSVVNAAARLTADARRYDHVTQLLMDLHWLRVPLVTHLVQAVRADVRLPEQKSIRILVGPDSVCRQTYRTSSAIRSASTSDLVVPPTRRASVRPCVRRCRSTSVEQSTASPPLNLQIVFFLQKKN